MYRFEAQEHCERNHASLPARWTGSDSWSRSSAGDVSATLNLDRLKSGVTLRQPKISECLEGTTRPAAVRRPDWDHDDDDDDDDDTDSEVGHH